MNMKDRRTCPSCGNELPEATELCPVCALRMGLTGRVESGESSVSEEAVERTPEQASQRFEHYELVRGQDGIPVELGRGAMGVTYKAFDVDLRCLVALKVITARFLTDESARLRFLREARVAASVRHPNVASVFHLGRTGGNYFYAMEFVEGETLEHLIKRSGQLKVKRALGIVTEVASGLAAVHEQNLVHRDIKPSNIMVRLKDDELITAKIIDLGLAKTLDESTSEAGISSPGTFAGTPEFASPEQFAGVSVDIRSDLYSLGVTLWNMLAGQPPFRGTSAELMHQHLHAPLPLELLEDIPQPVVALLELLLEKNPARRFQNPTNFLKVIPKVMRAVKARRTIKQQDLRKAFVHEPPSSGLDKSPAIRAPKRSIAVLPFETLSQVKGKTYFADGIQDEILSNLAKVSQLTVISRTSVMAFRPGDDRNLRSIADLLGVANVVEGTVRTDGKHVRLTIRLIDARRDKTLWSEIYDRSLTDIFAIQSEIARHVAARLSAQLSPEERREIGEKPTDNLEAYDLYLQAKQLINSYGLWSTYKKNITKAIHLLEEATAMDPTFALAYCRLADAHGLLYVRRIDHTLERRALSDASINEAMRLRPDLAEVHLAMAWHLSDCYREIERVRVQIAIAAKALPNNPELRYLGAVLDRRQGRWDEATAGLERAAILDPRNPDLLQSLAWTYRCLRRYRDAERILNRLIEIEPDQPVISIERVDCAFYEKAELEVARAFCEALPSSLKDDPEVAGYRIYYAMCARDFAAAEEILSKSVNEEIFWEGALVPRQIVALWLELVQGNHPTIEEYGGAREQLYRKVQADWTDPYLLRALAFADVALGRREEAIQEGRRAMEMRPISEDAFEGPNVATKIAVVYIWANQPDFAFEQLNTLIQMPGWRLNYGDLKTSPMWDPVRNDPRFEKLLAALAPNQSLQKTPPRASRAGARKPPAGLAPKKISIARLPVTGSAIFGREEDIAFLDRAWENKAVNVVTIVAWAGVGKSTLVNHWLRRMAAKHYRYAELVFGWSFYRQGSSGETSSADEFLDAALAWFGDPDPRLGTEWEKGERLAKLVALSRTLLVLDGLEPLQNPPGPQEGRLREPFLQALLRELAAFNIGLCVITTRTPVGDIADHERTSALRRDLEQLSSDAGAKLLHALGVKGYDAELQSASDEFSGHCLALTLLGSYLTDAFNGDIRFRKEVSQRLAHDVRQGVHARKVMQSYQTWFGEGPELSVLRMLGLFDRPADKKSIGALIKSPPIPGLTESLADLGQFEWRAVLARLRRAKLLAAEDPSNPGQLDTHPLVREYFGEQLRIQRVEAWKESNRRLYNHYRALAPELPETLREMEPLFLAVVSGCNAGLYREALHEIYVPRIQRGNAFFAANVFGARGTLLSVLGHFFENGDWVSPVETGTGEQSLSGEDQLFILMQAGQYLTATRGFAAPEVRICYERAESLCCSLNRPLFLYVALMGQWRHSTCTERLTASLQIAQRIYAVAREQNEPALMIGALTALANNLYYLGDFEAGRQNVTRGVQLWRSLGAKSPAEEVDVPAVSILCYQAVFDWHVGEIKHAHTIMAEAISLAKSLNDMHGLAVTLSFVADLAYFERNLMELEQYSSDLIELATRHNFAYWLAYGAIIRGWARSASGSSAEGISLIEQGIRDFRASGSVLALTGSLPLKAEALHLANRTSEALEAINEAEALSEGLERRDYCAELHRLRGLFLATLGAEEAQIEASFYEAIRIAREQKSISLEKRAEATYAEYRRQKACAAGGRGFRIPI
jgi:serine/threonine protein kinase/Tfp pilus assembly protein PilF